MGVEDDEKTILVVLGVCCAKGATDAITFEPIDKSDVSRQRHRW